MNFIFYNDNPKIAVLIKDSYFNGQEIQKHYSAIKHPFMAANLYYGANNKITLTKARDYLLDYLPDLVKHGVTVLYVADSTYFKALTKETTAEKHLGYVLPCKLKGYEHLSVVYGINYAQLMYSPMHYTKLDLSISALNSYLDGTYQPVGDDIIHSAIYNDPSALNKLLTAPMLAIDIETTGLALGSEIISIAFATDEHNGIAFKVTDKRQLKLFFEKYTGFKIFHNASFDVKQIIYHCFMTHPADYQGLLHGCEVMYRNLHDTKIIAYLATNNTQGNELGLKALSTEYAGNYGVDVTDVTLLSDDVLLEYNLKDVLSTWYVYKKYIPILFQDNQESIYKELMLPSLKVITCMELVGMPIDLEQVNQVDKQLNTLKDNHLNNILSNPRVNQAELLLKQRFLKKRNSELKTKQLTLDDISLEFNPASTTQLQALLYEVMKLPIVDYTKTKQPATGTSTLNKLIHHCNNENDKSLLQALIGLNQVDKILTTFIPVFKKAKPKDGWNYLHGNFNLGGTLSGRLSSSNPNLQNLPSGSVYGKLIKTCFKAPKGWVFCGADFQALEDKVNTLLTRDPNKEKVWIDGYDGHCYRAYYYFKDKMPDIVDTVESINSIKHKYPQYRQDSKAPSFALQYSGTHYTLMTNCGFDEPTAIQIETNYHIMYKVSDEWLENKLMICQQQGYIDTAFGLRIRTPVVGKSILGTTKTPYLASAEARSVGNAISGQSYGLLTNRAVNAFMKRVWESPYRYDILPVSLIHDAIYLMIKDNVHVIKFVNDVLIEEMQWQELPELQHDKIKLGAELGLFYPNWSNEITLPNNISRQEIKEIVKSELKNISK